MPTGTPPRVRPMAAGPAHAIGRSHLAEPSSSRGVGGTEVAAPPAVAQRSPSERPGTDASCARAGD